MKKRILSGALALMLALGCMLPAGAYEIPAVCDETYYATLDYYGAVSEAGVVKSYALNGQSTVTDYGDYDEVINLTDTTQPIQSGGKLVFTPKAGTDKFYFEGKTSKPFEALPWTIAVSYKLNGAPALAPDLAGRTGLVEIDVDVTPNPRANDYTRTNLVLTVATAFNDDNVTSLEAPGAEVQLLGNLRTVLFSVLPGEEQHFAIRVGSNSFESAGLVFLAVPATLGQLEQVATLREAKEEVEDDLSDISGSLDEVLDALDNASGGLNAAAGGLDRLNAARGTISGRKDDIYAAADGLDDLENARATLSAGRDDLSQKTDAALGSLGSLSGSLATLDRYGAVATQAVDDTVAQLNDMNSTVQGLKEHLQSAREVVVKLQGDTANLSAILEDVKALRDQAGDVGDELAWSLDYLEEDMTDFQEDLEKLERALRLTTGVSALSTDDLLSLLSPGEQAQMKEVLSLHKQYETYLNASGLTEGQLSFRDFIIAGAYQQFCEKTVADAVAANAPAAVEQAVAAQSQAAGRELTAEEIAAIQAQVIENVTAAAKAQLPSLEQFVQAPAAQSYVQQAQAASDAYDQFAAKLPLVQTANRKIKETNTVVTNITSPTGKVIGDLADLCREANAVGLPGDISETIDLCRDLRDTLEKYKGSDQALLDHADEIGDLVRGLTVSADGLLEELDSLTGLVNTYAPELKQGISDVTVLSGSLQATLDDTAAALSSAKDLLHAAGGSLDSGTEKTLSGLGSAVDAMRTAGGDLDGGTQAALSGLSSALRQFTAGLGQTGAIRNTKSSLEDLVTDQWDAHSGQVDTLLLIDPEAAPVSMTSEQNPSPRSVQYIMRTQEIKVAEDTPTAQAETQEAPERSFWQRIGDMFVGIWNAIVGFFTGKD